jgi:hypothetical protein
MIMVTVANFCEFAVRTESADRIGMGYVDELVVYTKEGCTQIMIRVDHSCLKAFDIDSWKCLSSCQLERTEYIRMYQLSENMFLFCHDGRIFRVSSTAPLDVQLHGRTDQDPDEDNLYCDVCVLDSETLIAVTAIQKRVDLLSPTGKLLRCLTIDCVWRFPLHVSAHVGGGIVTVYDGESDDEEDGDDTESYMVCLSVSEGRSLSLKWTSEPRIWRRNPVIASGVVIVMCRNKFTGYEQLSDAVLVLSLDSGRQLMEVLIGLQLSNGPSFNAICVYEERLFIGCHRPDCVVEFQLTGKLTCTIVQ